jgi:hypothetical protein
VSGIPDIPISHTGPLAPLPPGERAPVYREAAERAESEGRKLTAADIAAAAEATREHADRLDHAAEQNAAKAEKEREQADLLAAAAERVDASAVGYRATSSRFRSQVSQALLALDVARMVEVQLPDERSHLASFARTLRDFADRLDAELAGTQGLRLVEGR